LIFGLREDRLMARGRCGAKGRFLKKAPQKLFSGGQLSFASFLVEKLWLLRQSEPDRGKKKASFLFPSIWLGPRDSFRARNESQENDLDSSRQMVLGGTKAFI